MASNGPTKITADEMKKFQAILKLPAGVEKTQAQKELSPEENAKFLQYVALLQKKQKVKALEKANEESVARQQELEATGAAAQERAKALQIQMQEAEAKLKALQLREAELQRQDKAILTQASAQYAKTLDTITRKPVAKAAVAASTPTLKY